MSNPLAALKANVGWLAEPATSPPAPRAERADRDEVASESLLAVGCIERIVVKLRLGAQEHGGAPEPPGS